MPRVVIHNHFPARTVDSYREFPQVLAQAASIDPLHYLQGLKKWSFIRDTDEWNADYDFDNDAVTIRDKFHKKPFRDRVQILLHEGGHRGQNVDPETFEAFKKQGLVTEPHFLAMANDVHKDDFKKNGIGKATMADECFAESYSRHALDWPLPEKIKQFWIERAKR